MQGYITAIKTIKDEDLIVDIITAQRIYSTYRFYGVRHGTINIGFKIDFEIETGSKNFIPRLKDVMHLNFPWIFDKQKLYHWQRFLKLFSNHFKDVDEIDSFYFELLENCVKKITKQNEKRVLVEAYIKLLEFEGRLHNEFICLLCDEPIEHKINLVRAYLPAHPSCSYTNGFDKVKITELFLNKSAIFFEDNEIDKLWHTLLQGL